MIRTHFRTAVLALAGLAPFAGATAALAEAAPERVHFPAEIRGHVGHVFSAGMGRYIVEYDPGFVGTHQAVAAIQPLCAAQGKTATGIGDRGRVSQRGVAPNLTSNVYLAYTVQCR